MKKQSDNLAAHAYVKGGDRSGRTSRGSKKKGNDNGVGAREGWKMGPRIEKASLRSSLSLPGTAAVHGGAQPPAPPFRLAGAARHRSDPAAIRQIHASPAGTHASLHRAAAAAAPRCPHHPPANTHLFDIGLCFFSFLGLTERCIGVERGTFGSAEFSSACANC